MFIILHAALYAFLVHHLVSSTSVGFWTPLKVQFKEYSVTTDASGETALAAAAIYGEIIGFRLFRGLTSIQCITVCNSEPEKKAFIQQNTLLFGLFYSLPFHSAPWVACSWRQLGDASYICMTILWDLRRKWRLLLMLDESNKHPGYSSSWSQQRGEHQPTTLSNMTSYPAGNLTECRNHAVRSSETGSEVSLRSKVSWVVYNHSENIFFS